MSGEERELVRELVSRALRAKTAPPAQFSCKGCGRDTREHTYTLGDRENMYGAGIDADAFRSFACGHCWDRWRKRTARGVEVDEVTGHVVPRPHRGGRRGAGSRAGASSAVCSRRSRRRASSRNGDVSSSVGTGERRPTTVATERGGQR